MKKVLLILLIAGLCIGLGFGISKLISPEEEAPAPTSTWFSANLPGAMQHCFLTFDNVRDFDNVKPELSNGTLVIEDGALVLKSAQKNSVGDNSIVFLDNYLRTKQDVIVADFDISFPSGIPDTVIGLSETDSTGLQGNSDATTYTYGTTSLSNKSLAYLDVVHVTLLYFSSNATLIAYVNGNYVDSRSAFYSQPELTILGGAYATDNGIGIMKIDNVEITTFGNGDGSYDGVLNLYRDNFNLNIGELMGVK